MWWCVLFDGQTAARMVLVDEPKEQAEQEEPNKLLEDAMDIG